MSMQRWAVRPSTRAPLTGSPLRIWNCFNGIVHNLSAGHEYTALLAFALHTRASFGAVIKVYLGHCANLRNNAELAYGRCCHRTVTHVLWCGDNTDHKQK